MAPSPHPPRAGEERDCDEGRWGSMISARVNNDRHRKNMAAGPIPPPRRTDRSIDKKDDGGGLTLPISKHSTAVEKIIAASPIPPRAARIVPSTKRTMGVG